ncbi:hypothetical protein GGE67_002748 [Rhizobium leucaenae]|uniref:Uncharacterized protein n=1 Tax=Rhizobium leucaenae TaxID=29450 RepID=A0A7W6ZU51_9HYPH|nr:hypothetical protein [Rhizobium leucaenae]MBB6302129.1 hypothetical protein [Rhizobium leucaenae]
MNNARLHSCLPESRPAKTRARSSTSENLHPFKLQSTKDDENNQDSNGTKNSSKNSVLESG